MKLLWWPQWPWFNTVTHVWHIWSQKKITIQDCEGQLLLGWHHLDKESDWSREPPCSILYYFCFCFLSSCRERKVRSLKGIREARWAFVMPSLSISSPLSLSARLALLCYDKYYHLCCCVWMCVCLCTNIYETIGHFYLTFLQIFASSEPDSPLTLRLLMVTKWYKILLLIRFM